MLKDKRKLVKKRESTRGGGWAERVFKIFEDLNF